MIWEDITPEDILRMEQETKRDDEWNPDDPDWWDEHGFKNEEDYWRWKEN